MTTVTGPGQLPQRPEDAVAAERRAQVQKCFDESSPTATQANMLKHSVTAAEMVAAMDYKLDALRWMRMNGFPDGFQGLKVWPDADINAYLTWKSAQPNPFGPGTHGDAYQAHGIDPATNSLVRAQAQEQLDLEAARKNANPAYVSPWKAG